MVAACADASIAAVAKRRASMVGRELCGFLGYLERLTRNGRADARSEEGRTKHSGVYVGGDRGLVKGASQIEELRGELR